ncbi:MAG: hypothetical protein U0841_25700 [Chloroflexia bacterium]
MSKVKTLDLVLAALVAGGRPVPVRRGEPTSPPRGFALALLAAVVAGGVGTFLYDRLVTNPVEVGSTEVPQPAISRFLFHDTRAAALWLVVRFYVGFQWLEAGFHKVTDANGAWDYGNGAGLLGYWKGAWPSADRLYKISYDWHRTSLQTLIDHGAQSWFAPLIVARCARASASSSAGWWASRPSSGR